MAGAFALNNDCIATSGVNCTEPEHFVNSEQKVQNSDHISLALAMKLVEIVLFGSITNGIFGTAGVEICQKPKKNRNSKMAAMLARVNEVDSDALEKHAEIEKWENPTQDTARFHVELGKMVSLHRVTKDPFTHKQGYPAIQFFMHFNRTPDFLQCNTRHQTHCTVERATSFLSVPLPNPQGPVTGMREV